MWFRSGIVGDKWGILMSRNASKLLFFNCFYQPPTCQLKFWRQKIWSTHFFHSTFSVTDWKIGYLHKSITFSSKIKILTKLYFLETALLHEIIFYSLILCNIWYSSKARRHKMQIIHILYKPLLCGVPYSPNVRKYRLTTIVLCDSVYTYWSDLHFNANFGRLYYREVA